MYHVNSIASAPGRGHRGSGSDLAAEKAEPCKPPFWAHVLLIFPLFRLIILTRGLTGDQYSSIDMWGSIDILLTLLCGFVVLCHWSRLPWQKIRQSPFRWFLYYYIFCLFSFLWRMQGTSYAYIIYRATCMLIMSLYIVWLISGYKDKSDALLGIMRLLAVITLLGLYKAIHNGDLHTNSYSLTAGVLSIICLTARKYRLITWGQGLAYGGFGFLALALGTSSGSNIAFAIALLFFLCLNSQRKFSVWKFFIYMLIGYILYALFFDSLFHLLFPGKTLEGVQSGTGRFRIWEIFWDLFLEEPWLGLGFAVGERAGAFLDFFYTIHSHNGYLSILLNTGIAGGIIFGAFFFGFWRDIFVALSRGDAWAAIVGAAFAMISVNNLSVAAMGTIWGSLAAATLLVIAFHVCFSGTGTRSRSLEPEQQEISK